MNIFSIFKKLNSIVQQNIAISIRNEKNNATSKNSTLKNIKSHYYYWSTLHVATQIFLPMFPNHSLKVFINMHFINLLCKHYKPSTQFWTPFWSPIYPLQRKCMTVTPVPWKSKLSSSTVVPKISKIVQRSISNNGTWAWPCFQFTHHQWQGDWLVQITAIKSWEDPEW